MLINTRFNICDAVYYVAYGKIGMHGIIKGTHTDVGEESTMISGVQVNVTKICTKYDICCDDTNVMHYDIPEHMIFNSEDELMNFIRKTIYG